MKAVPTPIAGLSVIDIVPHEDERGLFARTWDLAVARQQGLMDRFDYSCISTNLRKGTLRGMHYQTNPYGETKLVRCTKGAIFDVAIDLRPESPTFTEWFGVKLTLENHRALYVPAGCAHGFVTLTDDTEVLYMIAGSYHKDAEGGVRWNDPAFGIVWPLAPSSLSERDALFPDFIA